MHGPDSDSNNRNSTLKSGGRNCDIFLIYYFRTFRRFVIAKWNSLKFDKIRPTQIVLKKKIEEPPLGYELKNISKIVVSRTFPVNFMGGNYFFFLLSFFFIFCVRDYHQMFI